MKKSKKVFLHAYCKNNVGDDMFVLTMAKKFPHVNFHAVVEKKYRKVFENQKNITMLDGYDEYGIKGRLKLRFCYDAFVKLGGSIFMEPKDWVKQPPFPKWQCLLLNKNKFIIGANFGPCYTKEFYERAKGSLKYYKGLCFRDRYSYNLFKDLKNAQYAPDILFGYNGYPEYKKGTGVAISLIRLDHRADLSEFAGEYYSTLAKACDAFSEKNIPVKLFSFCESEGDEEAISKVLELVKDESKSNISVYNYKGNIEEFLSEFNSCEYIAATRFHAMVLGISMGKKVYPIAYSQKLINVLEDIGFLLPQRLDNDITTSEDVVKSDYYENPIDNSQKYWSLLDGQQKSGEELAEEILSSSPFELTKEFIEKSKDHFNTFAKYIK